MKRQNKKLERLMFAKKELMVRFSAEGPFYDLVGSFTNIKKGERVLDIGCGTGVYGIRMGKEGAKVVGVDISKEAVEFANKWASEQKIDFQGVVGDAERLPFKDEVFDLVFYGAVLHHFPDFSKVISEGKRVLKKNGRLILIEPNGYNPVLRLSRFFARFLPERFSYDIHATKNETIHPPRVYKNQLKKYGFIITKQIFFKKKPIHKQTITKNAFLRLAGKLKKIGFNILSFGPPFLGSEYFLLSANLGGENAN